MGGGTHLQVMRGIKDLKSSSLLKELGWWSERGSINHKKSKGIKFHLRLRSFNNNWTLKSQKWRSLIWIKLKGILTSTNWAHKSEVGSCQKQKWGFTMTLLQIHQIFTVCKKSESKIMWKPISKKQRNPLYFKGMIWEKLLIKRSP